MHTWRPIDMLKFDCLLTVENDKLELIIYSIVKIDLLKFGTFSKRVGLLKLTIYKIVKNYLA